MGELHIPMTPTEPKAPSRSAWRHHQAEARGLPRQTKAPNWKCQHFVVLPQRRGHLLPLHSPPEPPGNASSTQPFHPGPAALARRGDSPSTASPRPSRIPQRGEGRCQRAAVPRPAPRLTSHGLRARPLFLAASIEQRHCPRAGARGGGKGNLREIAVT